MNLWQRIFETNPANVSEPDPRNGCRITTGSAFETNPANVSEPDHDIHRPHRRRQL